MEQQQPIRYPVGVQNFDKIMEEGYLYADKTGLIYSLTHEYDYVFLSRPRRFGKSLLASTLRFYFEGRRDLFKGLEIEKLEKDWTRHPVIHLSLASIKERDVPAIKQQIANNLNRIENQFELESKNDITSGDRLMDIIISCHKKYEKKAVVIIDEYDAPLLNNLSGDNLSEVRDMMRALFAPLKDCLEHIRFVFITGITKFSQLSIFSELNNLENISMNPRYAAICGITQHELETQFSDGVDAMARQQECSRRQLLEKLKNYYNGYRFAKSGEAVYNPFSLIRALKDRDFNLYWFETGTPTFIIETMKRFNTRITDIESRDIDAQDFDTPTEGMTSAIPLIYQSGYITIKSYDRLTNSYTLGFPNNEVKVGFMRLLLATLANNNEYTPSQTMIRIIRPILADDIDGALKFLQRYLKSIPYQEGTRNSEGHYTALLYVIFTLTCDYVQSQVRTSDGRIDILLTTGRRNYLMELKLNGTAQQALEQIDSKDYPLAVTNDLPTLRVGINFSTETGTISEWIIKE